MQFSVQVTPIYNYRWIVGHFPDTWKPLVARFRRIRRDSIGWPRPSPAV